MLKCGFFDSNHFTIAYICEYVTLLIQILVVYEFYLVAITIRYILTIECPIRKQGRVEYVVFMVSTLFITS